MIPCGDLSPSLNKPVETPQLRKAEGGLDVGDPVVEAEIEHLEVPAPLSWLTVAGNPMGSKPPETVCKLRMIGQDHSPLAGCDRFDEVEAQNRHVRVTAAPDLHPSTARAAPRSSPVGSTKGLGRILDDQELMPASRPVDPLMSPKTGYAPQYTTQLAAAAKLNGDVITSSPA